MTLQFCVECADRLVLPAPASPVRTDGLWKHSCFELFVMLPGSGGAYAEFNFSPSTQWAAYHFTGYRDGMAPLDLPAAPQVSGRRDGEDYLLEVTLALPPGIVPGASLGLSAVIEEAGGITSYWALAHPPERPDFHDARCFAGKVPAGEAT